MGLFSSLGSTLARVGGDVMTFGTNELVGNPIGKFADSILNPSDPNAGTNAAIAQNNANQLKINEENIAMQKEFAQNGIQWKVADAAKAGISPLAALGAVDPGFSPSTPAFTAPLPADTSARDTGMRMLANMGQDLFRSRLNAMSEADRAITAANAKRAVSEADLVDTQARMAKLQLSRMSAAPPNPAIPSSSVTLQNEDGSYSIFPSDPQAMRATPFTSFDWVLHNRTIPAVRDLKINLWDHRSKD